MRHLQRRSMLRWSTLALGAGCIGGCGFFGEDEPPPPVAPPPPPPPTVVSIVIAAASDINPDLSGRPSPVQVRILELANGMAFSSMDFFALQDASTALGADLVAEDTVLMTPGGTHVYQRELDDAVKVMGLIANFRELEGSTWQAWMEVPPNATSLLEASINGQAISLSAAGL